MRRLNPTFNPGDLIVLMENEGGHRAIYVLLERFQDPDDEYDDVQSKKVKRRFFWRMWNTSTQREMTHYERTLRHKVVKYPQLWKHIKQNNTPL